MLELSDQGRIFEKRDNAYRTQCLAYCEESEFSNK